MQVRRAGGADERPLRRFLKDLSLAGAASSMFASIATTLGLDGNINRCGGLAGSPRPPQSRSRMGMTTVSSTTASDSARRSCAAGGMTAQ